MKIFIFITGLIFYQVNASIDDLLLEAVRNDRIKKVETLLKACANQNASRCEVTINKYKKKFDFSNFEDSVWTRPWDPPHISTYIIGKIFDATCLFFALENNNIDIVNLLIQFNLDITAPLTFSRSRNYSR